MKRGAFVVLLAACVLAGCGRQHVVTQPELPPLAPPVPPPHVVTPPSATEEEPVAPKASEPAHKPARPQPPKTDSTHDTKPDAARRDPNAKGETPPAHEESPTPAAPVLQTTPPASLGEMDKQARAALAQATRDLGRVNRNALNTDGRGQYDTARRFVEQAQQALKQQNFVLALTLANKAATIAAVLAGR